MDIIIELFVVLTVITALNLGFVFLISWLFRKNPEKYRPLRVPLITMFDTVSVIGAIVWLNRSNLAENALTIAIVAGVAILTSSLFVFSYLRSSNQKSE
ncbi:MAG: hypothetical protein IMW86_04620 [Hydrogenibacillus sp.]|nr:hypothetical protein [Hydrogenibacillus sp.]